MAFYALWKWFSTFRKSHYPNMIYIYSEYYCKTEEQRKLEAAKRKQDAAIALANLRAMNAALSRYGMNFESNRLLNELEGMYFD